MIQSTPSITGGELAVELRDQYHAMRKSILNQPGVHSVKGLIFDPEASFWCYWIETTFSTFPRHVIGLASPDLATIDIVIRGNDETNANLEWQKLCRFRGVHC